MVYLSGWLIIIRRFYSTCAYYKVVFLHSYVVSYLPIDGTTLYYIYRSDGVIHVYNPCTIVWASANSLNQFFFIIYNTGNRLLTLN